MVSSLIVIMLFLGHFLYRYIAIDKLREDVGMFSTEKRREELILNLSFEVYPDYSFTEEELKEAEKIAYDFWKDLKGWFFRYHNNHLKSNINIWSEFYRFVANYRRSAASLKLYIAIKRRLIARYRKFSKETSSHEETLYAEFKAELPAEDS